MEQPIELPLEKQFSVRSFENQVSQMNLQQAQECLVELYEQMLVRETLYQQFLKHNWGLDSLPNLD